MLARWCRLLVALGAAVAIWAIATPAYAAAPLCDPHAATGVAPAPQLQQPQSSLDVATSEECSITSALATALANGRAAPEPAPARSASAVGQDQLIPSAAPIIRPAVSTESFSRDGVSGSERAGARARVDRPPRG